MKDMKALQNGSDIRGIALPVEGYEVNLTTDMVKKIGWGLANWIKKRRNQPIQIKNGRLGLVMTVG
ncbi:hypothetical protein LOS20_10390 [Enterococcus faecium]|nr:hypothetical protein [Enterococcus faecium]